MNKIAELRTIVEAELSAKIEQGEPKRLYEPIGYILALGGKRIRPAMVLAAYLAYNKDISNDARSLAAIVEMFHNFTLLHDDIMDGSALRRGQETVHIKWDEPTAILSGDLLQIIVYKHLHKIQNTQVLSDFDQMAVELCEGQMMDMEFEESDHVSNEDYLTMIRKKTAVLLAYSLKSGATLANAEPSQADKLYEIGIHLGLSFQLMDDYLDTFGSTAKVGKRIGGDILEQKKTYLWNAMYLALDQSQKADIEQLRSSLSEQEYIDHIVNLMEETGAKRATLELAQEHHRKAQELIKGLHANNDLSYLQDILQALDQRTS